MLKRIFNRIQPWGVKQSRETLSKFKSIPNICIYLIPISSKSSDSLTKIRNRKFHEWKRCMWNVSIKPPSLSHRNDFSTFTSIVFQRLKCVLGDYNTRNSPDFTPLYIPMPFASMPLHIWQGLFNRNANDSKSICIICGIPNMWQESR